MHTISSGIIMPNAKLTCITTDKFKTGFISVNFLTPLSSKTVSKNALLPRVLRLGTSEHPDMQSITAALNELYGAKIEPIVRKKGETLCVGLYASFVDDDFVPESEMILEKTVSLIGEMILSPATRGGLLLEKYVESEKNNLIDEIRNAKNDKIRYAITRMLETMCKNEAFGISSLGTEETVSVVTNRSLTKHYKELISTSKIEIIYCGSATFDRVSAALTNAFAILPRRNTVTDTFTKIVYAPPVNAPVTAYDTMEVSQGKLTMGFRLGKAMQYPNIAALMVFNAMFGGSVTSKLFSNVRERLSLCYYANSMLDRIKGVMIVYSGVEFTNFQKAYDEILTQLEDIKTGNFSDFEFDSAKKFINTSIRLKTDSATGIEDHYLESIITDADLSPDKLTNSVFSITRDDIINTAENVMLDTVHYITSEGGDTFEA